MKGVKIYGLMRAGTNYLAALLRVNFNNHVIVNDGGWKHGLYHEPSMRECLGSVVMVRDPYAWLVSVWKRYEGGRGRPFREYLQSDGEIAIQLWNASCACWLAVAPLKSRIVIVQFERFVRDAREACGAVRDALGLCPSPAFFSNVVERVGPGEKKEGRAFNREDVLRKAHLGRYTTEMLDFANARLDDSIVKEMGYTRA